jgi:hypothetical protein
MGWLLDWAAKGKAKGERAPSYAALATWMAKRGLPKGGPKAGALANNLAKLDRREMLGWWLHEDRAPYREVLSKVLDSKLTDLEEEIRGASASADPDRFFEFEVFPNLSPIDLDRESPYPGVPEVLLEGDGPLGRTWWHAPPGAGRTLVSRWLCRRHGWSVATSLRPAPDSAIVELDALPAEVAPRARRILVASPHRMPAGLAGWTEVSPPPRTEWVSAFARWVRERLRPGGCLDPDAIQAALSRDRRPLPFDTPGQLLELLASADQVGIDALYRSPAPREALRGWVKAHAGRSDRKVATLSGDHLLTHGAELLTRIELTRRARGLPVTTETVMACLPPLAATPSANDLYALAHAGKLEELKRAIRPSPADILEAMRALRWLPPEGSNVWGFPSHVLRQLAGAVTEAAVSAPLATLGGLLDDTELVEGLVWELSDPVGIAGLIRRLVDIDYEDPAQVVALDGIAKGATLAVARGARVDEHSRQLLVAAIRRATGPTSTELPVRVRLPAHAEPECWDELARLIFSIGARGDTPDWTLARTVDRGLVARPDDPTGRAGPLLRTLAVDTLRALVEHHPDTAPPDLVAAAVRDLLRGGSVAPDDHARCAQIGPAVVVARVWAGVGWEKIASRLWTVWLATTGALPWLPPGDDADQASLTGMWTTVPAGLLEQAHAGPILDQATLGVALPPAVWRWLLTTAEGDPRLAKHLPVEILLEHLDAGGPPWAYAAGWARAPDHLLERLRGVLASGPIPAAFLLLESAPVALEGGILRAMQTSPIPHSGLETARRWLEKVIARRGEEWRLAYAVWRTLGRGSG